MRHPLLPRALANADVVRELFFQFQDKPAGDPDLADVDLRHVSVSSCRVSNVS